MRTIGKNGKPPQRRCIVCRGKFEVKSNTHWICSIECAKVKGNEAVEKKKAEIIKRDWNEEKAALKINTHSKENKKHLQDEINKLSRLIDAHFGFTTCIDCGKPFDDHQIDACHLISRGSNSTLKYNLHNLHSGHNHCNKFNPTHESNYKKGLAIRYGLEYLQMVEGLSLKYPEIHLSNVEVSEKLKLVRSLNRNFHTYKLTDGNAARDLFNTLINIYK